jgi:hypothetical protein
MKLHPSTEQEIRSRAEQIFVQNGCVPGHDTDNWLQAEYELMQLPVDKIAELAPVKVKRGKAITSSLVCLIHAALLLEANGLTQHLRR